VNVSLSFVRGMIAAVNPCGFVLLPSYLMYFLGLSSSVAGRQRASVGRALVVSAAVSGGFLAVFLVIGVITQAFTGWVTENAKYATGVIGGALVVLGAAMLFGFRPSFATPQIAAGRDRTLRSMFLYGLAYAVCSIGCTIGLFMSTLFGTATRAGYAAGVGNIVVYGAGMALVVSALTVTLAVANVGLLRVLRRGRHYIEMVAGAFVLLSGAYVLWYFWKVGLQETGDPVTDAVQRYQTDVQVFVNDNWRSITIVLLAVVAGAATYALLGHRARITGPRDAPTVPSSDS
jgi:cytochrome c-type biogenesis protein